MIKNCKDYPWLSNWTIYSWEISLEIGQTLPPWQSQLCFNGGWKWADNKEASISNAISQPPPSEREKRKESPELFFKLTVNRWESLNMSTTDDVRFSESRLSSVKSGLETWREVVIRLDSLLGNEHNVSLPVVNCQFSKTWKLLFYAKICNFAWCLHASVLISGWECDWYPAVSGGMVTAGFLWVWYWDPTLLTFIALMGLLVTLVDYVGPKIINQVSFT